MILSPVLQGSQWEEGRGRSDGEMGRRGMGRSGDVEQRSAEDHRSRGAEEQRGRVVRCSHCSLCSSASPDRPISPSPHLPFASSPDRPIAPPSSPRPSSSISTRKNAGFSAVFSCKAQTSCSTVCHADSPPVLLARNWGGQAGGFFLSSFGWMTQTGHHLTGDGMHVRARLHSCAGGTEIKN